MASASTLHTPRELLGSLLSPPPSASEKPLASTQHQAASGNPLHNAPQEVKSVLMTLHILYPALLLPALDLLDRNLVTRVVQESPAQPTPAPFSPGIVPPQAHCHLLPEQSLFSKSAQEEGETIGGVNGIYLVRSSKSSNKRSRFSDEKSYTVRTAAWNCTCAAFSFSAFPASASGDSSSGDLFSGEGREMDVEVQDRLLMLLSEVGIRESGGGGRDEKDEKWEFGGVSSAGVDGGAVPCCKHLFACVLAERWDPWFGRYVEERRVDRDEMAGLGCNG
jgi:hypothetical protein